MKTDVLHKLTNWIDHNRYTVLSLIFFVIAMGSVIAITGCESTTAGLVTTNEAIPDKVSRSEFQRQALITEKDFSIRRLELDQQTAVFNEEVKAFNEQVQLGLEDLQRQDEFKQQLLETAGVVITGATDGTLNPASLIPIGIGLLGGALGLGTSADNRRKDKLITNLKTTSTT